MPIPNSGINNISVFNSKTTNPNISNKNKPKKLISKNPIDFICENYSVVKHIGDMMSNKLGNELFEKDRKIVESECRTMILDYLKEKELLPIDALVAQYLKLIYDNILGLGMIQPLLDDKEIDEILDLAQQIMANPDFSIRL